MPGVHKLTLILGLVAIIFLIFSAINDRRKKQAYNFEVLPMNMFIVKLVFTSVLVGGDHLGDCRLPGLSWTAVVVLVVVLIYDFVAPADGARPAHLRGRRQPGGGRAEWHQRQTDHLCGFWFHGDAGGFGGNSLCLPPAVGHDDGRHSLELDAIAAAFIGGVSPAGGIGKVVGSIIGALVMMSLTSGMNLMGIGISYQYMARGAVLALAVIFDVATRSRAK